MEVTGIILCEYIRSLWTRNYRYEKVAYDCIRVNVMYTKLIQAIAAKYKSIYIHIDKIPYTEDEINIPDIQEAKIIGSGMVSIVFEGLQDDKMVVIKTKRVGIEEKIQKGLQSIYEFTRWIDWFTFSKYDLFSVYTELSEMVLSQLDFEMEAQNQIEFKKMFEYNPTIVVPEIYSYTNNQIVMSKLVGTPFDSLIDKEPYGKILASVIVKSLVLDGFIHSDIHVGNVVFMNDQLGILDFGLMVKLTKMERNHFFELFKEFAMDRPILGATKTLEYFIGPPTIVETLTNYQKEKIISFIVSIYNKSYVINKCFGVYDIVKIMHMLKSYNLVLSPLFYKIGVSITSIDILLKELSSMSASLIMNDMRDLISDLD